MMGSKRGGKRANAGRPCSEPTKMMRIPISLVDDFKNLIDLHKKGTPIDFDYCIRESKVGGFQDSLLPNQIASFELELVSRPERRRLKKMISKGQIQLIDTPVFNNSVKAWLYIFNFTFIRGVSLFFTGMKKSSITVSQTSKAGCNAFNPALMPLIVTFRTVGLHTPMKKLEAV